MNAFAVFIVAAVVLVFAIIGIYNSLVGKKNQMLNIEAGVDAQLKRRYDLLPNLVAAAKEYLSHERGLLEAITELRSSAQNARTSEEKFNLNNQLSQLLNGLKVTIENYPDLKANQNILHIQSTLSEIEEQISAARRAYNSSVEVYNNAIEMFPSNLIANSFGFKKAAFFDIPDDQSAAPDIGKMFKS
ncbi:LemA family protein [Campylobacter curvus]|uniref:LemA family protein n=1 Tax=Campylobacter curvus TaxID=200 RepID=UPI00146FE5F0|nr:LemA family protein [Campylobacter curvus]